MAESQREIETKYDVAPDFVLGDPAALAGPDATVDTRTVELTSAYYDTAEQNLRRSYLTLRRRTGDTDTGWHLKVPGAGFRTELHWPLAGNDAPPNELLGLIRPFTGDAPLQQTVTLHTTRTPDGVPVATPRWREVEVELGPAGTPADLKRAAELLNKRGAFASRAGSKLQRALTGLPPTQPGADTAAAVLAQYLRTQCDAMTAGHFAISLKPFEPSGTSEPHEAIHQTRVATRRLRAELRMFAPMFQDEPAARLQAELAWFAAELGEVRDREVLRSRLARAVDDLPAFLVVGPVAERIDEVLLAELRQHAEALLATMRDERYRVLVRDLAGWREQPAFSAAAQEPARVLAEQVAAAEHKLAKRMKRAAVKQAPPEELHAARKAGKRARYAAEAAAPALGKRASKLARRAANLQTLLGEHQDAIVADSLEELAEEFVGSAARRLAKRAAAVQKVLGEHQDAVVATELLRRIADQVADEGGNAFTYGILVADQRRIAVDSAQAARANTEK